MKLPSYSRKGFTLIELLVVIAIIAILASLAVPAISKALDKAKLTQAVNNGKQLSVLGNMMANDSASTGDPALGWPGDLMNATGTSSSGSNNAITDLNGYVQRMITYEYIKAGDLAKVMGGPNAQPWSGTGTFQDANTVWKVFKTTGSDPGNTLFLCTKNYTYNTAGLTTTKSFGDLGFVVSRKDSSATAFQKQQAQNILQIGVVPGSPDVNTPGSESGNILN